MEWQIIVALVVGIPIILFPVALVWFINIGSLYTLAKRARARQAVRKRVAHRRVAHERAVYKEETGELVGVAK